MSYIETRHPDAQDTHHSAEPSTACSTLLSPPTTYCIKLKEGPSYQQSSPTSTCATAVVGQAPQTATPYASEVEDIKHMLQSTNI